MPVLPPTLEPGWCPALPGGRPRRAAAAGFTVFEVTIVMSLFAMMLLVILQSLTGVRSFVGQAQDGNDLALEGRKVVEMMIKDLGNSAWYIPIDLDGINGPRPPYGTDTADLDGLLLPSKDRILRYYPYIQVQTTTGLGSKFPAHKRLPAEILDPTKLPPTLPKEHRKSSQEIIFLKVRTAPAAASPSKLATARLDFNGAPKTASLFASTRDGVVIDSVIATTSGGVVNDVPLAWESHLTTPNNNAPDDLREYTYVVVPNTGSGKGQLERRYRNGGAPKPLTDQVLSTNVDRLVVDTYRTLATLNVNQVRITVYLSKADLEQPGMFQTHRVEVTTALRSTVDPEYSLNLGDWLGDAGASKVQ